MVVEEIGDLWALERAGVVSGLYHVLGGHLSPLDGVGPEQLNIGKLVERAVPPVTEVLLALNATVEGQSTAHYLTEQLQGHGLTVTRHGAGRADGRRARLPGRGHAGGRHQEPADDVAAAGSVSFQDRGWRSIGTMGGQLLILISPIAWKPCRS